MTEYSFVDKLKKRCAGISRKALWLLVKSLYCTRLIQRSSGYYFRKPGQEKKQKGVAQNEIREL